MERDIHLTRSFRVLGGSNRLTMPPIAHRLPLTGSKTAAWYPQAVWLRTLVQ